MQPNALNSGGWRSQASGTRSVRTASTGYVATASADSISKPNAPKNNPNRYNAVNQRELNFSYGFWPFQL